MESPKRPRLVPLDIVPCNPQSRDAPPKGTREFRKRVKEPVVDDLVEESSQYVRRQEADQVHDEIGHDGAGSQNLSLFLSLSLSLYPFSKVLSVLKFTGSDC